MPTFASFNPIAAHAQGTSGLSPSQMFMGGSSQSSQDQIFGPQAAALSQFFPQIQSLMGRDPRSFIAGFNPTQQLAQQMGTGAAIGAQGLVGEGQQAFRQALDPMSAIQSPFFAGAYQAAVNPFIRNFQQDIIPGIRSQAQGVGQVGGSREGIAQGLATQGLQSQLGDIASQMGQNAFTQGLQQRTAALGLLPQTLQAGFAPSEYLSQIGTAQQAQAERELQSPLTFASQIQALLGQPTVLGQSRGVSQRGATQGFQDVFGGASSFAGG